MFHSVYPPRLSYPFPHWWVPDYVQLPIATTCCDEHLLCCPLWTCVESPLPHTYSRAEVLGHRVRTKYCKIDFQAVAPVQTLTVMKSPRSPCPHQHLTFSSFLTFNNMLNLKRCFIVVLICISLITNELEPFFIHIFNNKVLSLSFSLSPSLGISVYSYLCLIFLLSFLILPLPLKPELKQSAPTDWWLPGSHYKEIKGNMAE